MENDLLILIDNNTRNLILILEATSRRNRWYTLPELSDMLGVVERTTHRYIEQLIQDIDAYNINHEEKMLLYYEKNKGVYLETSEGDTYNRFKQSILIKDVTLQIMQQIFFEKFESVSVCAERFSISESSIRKSLKKIRKFLELNDLSLSNHTYDIIGEENQIRLIAYIIYLNFLHGPTWPFDTDNEKEIYELLDNYAAKINIHLSDKYKKQMSYMLAINAIRLSQNHMLTIEENWDDYVDIDAREEELTNLKVFLLNYNENIKAEMYFYAILIQTNVKLYEDKEFAEDVYNYHREHQSDVFEITELFIEKFNKNIIEIPVDLYDRVYAFAFCTHLFTKLFNHIDLDVQGNIIPSYKETTYQKLKAKLTKVIAVLKKETKNSIFKEEKFLIFQYMYLFGLIAPLNTFEPKISILLESDLPFLIQEAILNKVKTRYGLSYNLNILKEEEFEKADIIMTNIPRVLDLKDSYDLKILYFDYPIDYKKAKEFEKHMKAVYQSKCHD